MYWVNIFRSGIYFYFLPYHLIVIIFGVFVRALLKTPRNRWLWLSTEIIALILCEFGCTSADGVSVLASIVFYILAIDLLIGHSIIGIINAFRRLVDWLSKNEANE